MELVIYYITNSLAACWSQFYSSPANPPLQKLLFLLFGFFFSSVFLTSWDDEVSAIYAQFAILNGANGFVPLLNSPDLHFFGSLVLKRLATQQPFADLSIIETLLAAHARAFNLNQLRTIMNSISSILTGLFASCVRSQETPALMNTPLPGGMTMLHILVNTGKNVSSWIRRWVKKYGVNCNAKDRHGKTPIHSISNIHNVIELQERGCDLSVRDNSGHSALHKILKLAGETGIDCRMANGQCFFFDTVMNNPTFATATVLRHSATCITRPPDKRNRQTPWYSTLKDKIKPYFSATKIEQMEQKAFGTSAIVFTSLPEKIYRSISTKVQYISSDGSNCLFFMPRKSTRIVRTLIKDFGVLPTQLNNDGRCALHNWLLGSPELAIYCLDNWEDFKLDLGVLSSNDETLLHFAARGVFWKAAILILKAWKKKEDVWGHLELKFSKTGVLAANNYGWASRHKVKKWKKVMNSEW